MAYLISNWFSSNWRLSKWFAPKWRTQLFAKEYDSDGESIHSTVSDVTGFKLQSDSTPFLEGLFPRSYFEDDFYSTASDDEPYAQTKRHINASYDTGNAQAGPFGSGLSTNLNGHAPAYTNQGELMREGSGLSYIYGKVAYDEDDFNPPTVLPTELPTNQSHHHNAAAGPSSKTRPPVNTRLEPRERLEGNATLAYIMNKIDDDDYNPPIRIMTAAPTESSHYEGNSKVFSNPHLALENLATEARTNADTDTADQSELVGEGSALASVQSRLPKSFPGLSGISTKNEEIDSTPAVIKTEPLEEGSDLAETNDGYKPPAVVPKTGPSSISTDSHKSVFHYPPMGTEMAAQVYYLKDDTPHSFVLYCEHRGPLKKIRNLLKDHGLAHDLIGTEAQRDDGDEGGTNTNRLWIRAQAELKNAKEFKYYCDRVVGTFLPSLGFHVGLGTKVGERIPLHDEEDDDENEDAHLFFPTGKYILHTLFVFDGESVPMLPMSFVSIVATRKGYLEYSLTINTKDATVMSDILHFFVPDWWVVMPESEEEGYVFQVPDGNQDGQGNAFDLKARGRNPSDGRLLPEDHPVCMAITGRMGFRYRGEQWEEYGDRKRITFFHT